MKKVRFIAAVWMLLLAASMLASLCAPGPADVEAVIGGFTVVTPTPSPTPTLPPTPTPTPTPTPMPAHDQGGGGDGGGGGQIELEITIGSALTLWHVSSVGVLLEDVTASSPDGILQIQILKGTTVLDVNRLPLREISVNRITSLHAPPPGYSIVCAFDCGPDGATFNPPFTATVTISPGMLPSGFDASSLHVAWFDSNSGTWNFITGTFNPSTQKFSFSISHFCIYAVLMPGEATPTPALTPTPTPTSAAGTSLTGLWVALGIICGVGIIFLLIRRRRRQGQSRGG